MNKIKIFIELTRLNKPIGFMLLFWPCLWGLVLAFHQTGEFRLFINYIILFFLGSVLMRSAGCIFNDIADKDFDKKVDRTKNRPIPSGRISTQESFVYIILLCLVAFIILIQFNFLTIILGLLSIPLAFSYPYMKRLTYWPQLFLGLTFNWGILLGWTALKGEISLEPILLYIAAIFWTLGYDTIYGFQDIYDDEIIGVKSTSIKFKENYKLFIGLCYFICVLFLVILGFLEENRMYYFTFLIFPAMHLLHQMTRLDRNNTNSCLMIFKSNNFFGLLVFLTLMATNI
jgi:4-hydroxybenzoate polyprenyl transferase